MGSIMVLKPSWDESECPDTSADGWNERIHNILQLVMVAMQPFHHRVTSILSQRDVSKSSAIRIIMSATSYSIFDHNTAALLPLQLASVDLAKAPVMLVSCIQDRARAAHDLLQSFWTTVDNSCCLSRIDAVPFIHHPALTFSKPHSTSTRAPNSSNVQLNPARKQRSTSCLLVGCQAVYQTCPQPCDDP